MDGDLAFGKSKNLYLIAKKINQGIDQRSTLNMLSTNFWTVWSVCNVSIELTLEMAFRDFSHLYPEERVNKNSFV